MRKASRFMYFMLATIMLLLLSAGSSQAVLKDVGPIDPANGYPVWYRDNSSTYPGYPLGLPLQLCLDAAADAGNGPLCTLLPGGTYTGGTPVFPGNWPDETFWWTGDSAIDLGGGNSALLTLALEGAFAGFNVVDGDQISFARVRIRIDTPIPGVYTVYHPYGTVTDNVIDAGNGINITTDIGIGAPGDFTGALGGQIGPFLTCVGGPIDAGGGVLFVGDPNVECAVTGSPFDNNFFRVEGPPGSNLDGLDNTFVQTDQFLVMGKIYLPPIATAVSVDRATYGRNNVTGKIDVFATADNTSNTLVATVLEVSVPGGDNVIMNTDGAGNFFAHIPNLAPGAIPDNVTVTNTSDNVASVPPRAQVIPLADEVFITEAYHNPADNTLRIRASSSDKFVPPTLTATGFVPDLDSTGLLVVPNVPLPPSNIEVTSSANGSDVEPLQIGLPVVVTANSPPSVDFDGDGVRDIAVWRPGDGVWYIQRSSDGGISSPQWGSGALNDVPVPGDYDGDKVTDIAVWRPAEGIWYVLRSSDGGFVATQWGSGALNDVPLPGDYDNDGKTDMAVWRPSDGNWYVLRSSDAGITVTQWGTLDDVPIQ